MSIHKRSNSWYIDFRFRRKRYRKKSPINTKAGAEMYESTLRHRLARGESVEEEEAPKNKMPTLAEFYSTWMTSYVKSNNKPSTYLSKKSTFEYHMVPYFGKMLLDQIITKDVEDYKAQKLKSGLKSKTINNHISALGTCLKTAVDWNVIEQAPRIKLLKVSPPQTVYLTEDECKNLLDVAEGIYHDMIFTVLHTGLRSGELIGLKWSDIDFNSKTIKVQRSITVGIVGTPKSNKNRTIPISNSLLELLHTRERNGEYIFSKPDSSPMSQSQIEKKLKQLVRKTNITSIPWHGLRHTFASRLANSKVSVQVIQQLLGHADIKTTMRYAHIAPESLVKAIDVLEEKSEFWPLYGHKTVMSFSPEYSFVPLNTNKKA